MMWIASVCWGLQANYRPQGFTVLHNSSTPHVRARLPPQFCPATTAQRSQVTARAQQELFRRRPSPRATPKAGVPVIQKCDPLVACTSIKALSSLRSRGISSTLAQSCRPMCATIIPKPPRLTWSDRGPPPLVSGGPALTSSTRLGALFPCRRLDLVPTLALQGQHRGRDTALRVRTRATTTANHPPTSTRPEQSQVSKNSSPESWVTLNTTAAVQGAGRPWMCSVGSAQGRRSTRNKGRGEGSTDGPRWEGW
jgi:hypothetical protein